MITDLKYMPIFRSRQQEIIVLKESDFGGKIFPLIEIIKDKDRKNNKKTSFEIYSELVNDINAQKVCIDLPVYLQINSSTNNEVVAFTRSVIEDIDARIKFFSQFASKEKVIPVISLLTRKTGEINTIQTQFSELKNIFSNIAFRTFHNTFDQDHAEITQCIRSDSDFLLYDLDTASITSPLLRKHRANINAINAVVKVLIRSAINMDIKNIKLEHGNIVADADNSLVELFSNYDFQAFGDYVGIKKDDLTAGGTISPGFIFYDPFDNMYYGYRGDIKKLEEFETTIDPDVLSSKIVGKLMEKFPRFLSNNAGYKTLERISNGQETGKSQAKFKKIAMEHYLHCIKTVIDEDSQLPLSVYN